MPTAKEKLKSFMQSSYKFLESMQKCNESPQIPKVKHDWIEAVDYKNGNSSANRHLQDKLSWFMLRRNSWTLRLKTKTS